MTVKNFLETLVTDVCLYEVEKDGKIKEFGTMSEVCELYGDCIVSKWKFCDASSPYILVQFDGISLRLKDLINIP